MMRMLDLGRNRYTQKFWATDGRLDAGSGEVLSTVQGPTGRGPKWQGTAAGEPRSQGGTKGDSTKFPIMSGFVWIKNRFS